MSTGGYEQYAGNPYGNAEAGYAQDNPYHGGSAGYGASNTYGGTDSPSQHPPPLTQQSSAYSQPSYYSQPSVQQSSAYSQPPTQQDTAYSEPPPIPTSTTTPLPHQDFLDRISGLKSRIKTLSSTIQAIASHHQRLLSSPDAAASHTLEALVTDAQVRNTQIKDEIKFLERDAARDGQNAVKLTQINAVKGSFKTQLDHFYSEESDYRKRYRDAVARQYKVVNPNATEEEVQEAANADWGEGGVFAQALKSNRTATSTSVLAAVRARHADIAHIEKTMNDLLLLFRQLDEQVELQEVPVEQVEEHTQKTADHGKAANEQLEDGVKHAKRARRLKWWLLLTVVAIICILALVLGLYFGLRERDRKHQNQDGQVENQRRW